MPVDNENRNDLIDVGETESAEINLDDKGERKTRRPKEEKIEVEKVDDSCRR